MSKTIPDSEAIRTQYLILKKESEGILRSRNAADQLGISEGELLAAHVGIHATRLLDKPHDILQAILPLGEVLALTRNQSCVHERKGIYDNASFFSHGKMNMGLFVNPDIDLRLFMDHWKHCFSAWENDRKSLQFFDQAGEAVHKIFLTEHSNEAAYTALVDKYRHPEQEAHIVTESHAPKTPDRLDSEIDWEGFREAWQALKDTHDFHPMLNKFKVGRLQALRKIGTDLAYRVDNEAARKILQAARDRQCAIMVFVGNRGCIQIHTGPVDRLAERGPWYNVLDPQFNLHLREDHITQAWVTKKPTEDGTVTALEIFDKNNDLIATFFGKRKPGVSELPLWREIVEVSLAKETADAA